MNSEHDKKTCKCDMKIHLYELDLHTTTSGDYNGLIQMVTLQ